MKFTDLNKATKLKEQLDLLTKVSRALAAGGTISVVVSDTKGQPAGSMPATKSSALYGMINEHLATWEKDVRQSLSEMGVEE